MADTTSRFALPLLQPGQAQKELSHNEALALLDAALHPAVRGVGVDTPPSSPAPGEGWIIGATPTSDWAGHAKSLANWTAGGWRFIAPTEGMRVWSVQNATVFQYIGGSWAEAVITGAGVVISGLQVLGPRRAAIATPTGGSVTDAEARAALVQIIGALRGHGLIAS